MTKYYHMTIQHKGSAPDGWIYVGVCGYHEKTKKSKEN